TTAPAIAVTSTPCGAAPTGGPFSVTVPVCTPGAAQASPAAGNCIAVSTPPAAGTIAVAAGCTPYPTPTVSATATDCDAAVSASGRVVSVPVCAPSPNPTATTYLCSNGNGSSKKLVPCPVQFTPNPFEPAILARTDVIHFWELHDAPAAGAGTPGPC